MMEQHDARARLRQAMREACLADCRALGADATPEDDAFRMRLEKRLWAERATRRRRMGFRAAVAAVLVMVIGITVLFGVDTLSARPEKEYTLTYVPQDCIQSYHYTSSDSAYTRWTDPDSPAQLLLLQNSVSVDALLDLTNCDTAPVKVMDCTAMLYTKPGYAALSWQLDGYYFTMIFSGSNASDTLLALAQHLVLR
ncbi:MAG: hypothetical protein IJY28_09155 [Clostridia bacterium]|nr:hypothetical protein [Clostridia bacterium]